MALLQGLAYCGQCGHKMTVQYHAAARYICNSHKMQLGGKECQRLPIDPIDKCVVQRLWEALSPAELDGYDEAIAAFDEQRRQVERARRQQLERLRYEARLAEKQYRLVDAENRLVAAELERRWEQALQALHQGEAEAANGPGTAPEPLAAELRRQWEVSHPTLRRLWDEGKLTNVRKKELLRVLIDKVVLRRPATDRCEVRIIWKGGDWTTVELPLPVVKYSEISNYESLATEVLRRARAGHTDKQIAAELTAAGYHAPLKRCLSVHSIERIRKQHGVYSRRTEFLRQGLPGWITLGQAVQRLKEHKAWAYYLIREGRLIIERRPGNRAVSGPRRQERPQGVERAATRRTILTHPQSEVIMKRHRRPAGRSGRCSDKRRPSLQRRSGPGRMWASMRLRKQRRAFPVEFVSTTTVMDKSTKSPFRVKYPTKKDRPRGAA